MASRISSTEKLIFPRELDPHMLAHSVTFNHIWSFLGFVEESNLQLPVLDDSNDRSEGPRQDVEEELPLGSSEEHGEFYMEGLEKFLLDVKEELLRESSENNHDDCDKVSLTTLSNRGEPSLAIGHGALEEEWPTIAGAHTSSKRSVAANIRGNLEEEQSATTIAADAEPLRVDQASSSYQETTPASDHDDHRLTWKLTLMKDRPKRA